MFICLFYITIDGYSFKMSS